MKEMTTLPAPTCKGLKARSAFLIRIKELPQIKLRNIRRPQASRFVFFLLEMRIGLGDKK